MKLNCHCGVVEAEINVPVNELAKIVKCNCSICKRKSATMGMVKNEDFKITKGEDKLKLYQYHLILEFHCTKFLIVHLLCRHNQQILF